MKTEKQLGLEKYALEDKDIPKEIFVKDNEIALYGSMVPPGQHFFFLCFEKSTMFLSSKHEVVRFKNTNIYLNRIIVKPRLEDTLNTVFVTKGVEEEAEQFLKDRSVFASF